MRITILSILGLLVLFWMTFIADCSSADASRPPKGYLNETMLKVAYASGALKLIEAEPEIPAHLRSYENITYKTTPEKELKLDIYHKPDIQSPTPLLVFIHGGSWKKGNKDDYRRYLVDFAEKGFVTATIAYRFAQDAPFPAALEDVVCAVKWLKSNAQDYFIDTSRVAVVGGSAGGHLGMLLAYHGQDTTFKSVSSCEGTATPEIQALVNFYGPVDLTTAYSVSHPSVVGFLGQAYDETSQELYEAASPINFITPDDPPTLTFHGTLDDLVPVGQADTLDLMLKAVGVPSHYHRLKGWPHTMDLGQRVNNYCQYQMDAFFAQYLK